MAAHVIPSPYNFVPLSSHVVLPTWSHLVSHDVPFQGGISGWFDVDVVAKTPIFCRGHDGAFFKTEDGRYAIPGTTLRGALRNVVEITSFARMERVDDAWFGIRDLHNQHTYGGHMSDIVDGRLTPLVNAGWLRAEGPEDAQRWFIEPCHFAKVAYSILEGLGPAGFDPGKKQRAVDKYCAWVGRTPGKSALELSEAEWAKLESRYEMSVRTLSAPGTQSQRGAVRVSRYGEVAAGGRVEQGQLVFTGQPADFDPNAQRKTKYHDFFFYGRAGKEIDVTHLRAKFEGAHRDAGQQGRNEIKSNAEWAFWKARLRRGGRVPIFYITKPDGTDQAVRAFGLAMMFRLAYDHSTRQIVANVQKEAWDDPRPDLAELLFGYVRDRARQEGSEDGPFRDAMRGRVSVGQAVADGKPSRSASIRAIMGVPKPTFYPNYVVQGAQEGARPPKTEKNRRGNPHYAWSTYMTEAEGDLPRPRGWKRYVARDSYAEKPELPKRVKSRKVYTTLEPLAANTRFRARVRVHNLLPVELGALLWAIELGDVDQARHQLGQGRPFGLGQVEMKVVQEKHGLRHRGTSLDGQSPGFDACKAAFTGYMEHVVPGGWAQSVQMREFVALVVPIGDEAVERLRFRYPRLGENPSQNEFAAAKKEGAVLGLHSRGRSPIPVHSNPEAGEYWAHFGQETLGPAPDGEGVAPGGEFEIPREVRVQFTSLAGAQERRKFYGRQKKKGKIKPARLPLEVLDEALTSDPRMPAVELSTTETRNIEVLFQWLLDRNAIFPFRVRLPDVPIGHAGSIVVEEVILP